jgi:hypothetical protein
VVDSAGNANHMTDPAKTNQAAGDDAAGGPDEFAHIPRSRARHPIVALAGALLAFGLVFHLRHDLRYALSSSSPLELGAARTSFGSGKVGADLANRYVRVSGTPDRESALEIDTKGSWVFSQFFRILGTGDRLFLHRRESPLPAERAESDVFEGRLVRFDELSFADAIRAYFAQHVTATHFFARDAFARALAGRTGAAPLVLTDRAGDPVSLGAGEAIAIEVVQPDQVRIALPRSRFPSEAEARAAITTRGGEVLASRGLVKGLAPSGPDSGPLASGPPPPERWTLDVRFPAGRRQAALDEIGDLDRLVEIRDARETLTAHLAELSADGEGLVVRSPGAPERRLAPGQIAAVRTLAPVVIPPDAFLVVEGDRPREHAVSLFFALMLIMFGTVNVMGLVRSRTRLGDPRWEGPGVAGPREGWTPSEGSKKDRP